MSRAASAIPDENSMLCEGCGYILSGLPSDSRCPECGTPIEQSSPGLRGLPPWELEDGTTRGRRFWRTAFLVLLRPGRFYRTLATRADPLDSASFARRSYALASLWFSLAAMMHLHWLMGWMTEAASVIVFLAVFIACYLLLTGIVSLAARLTAWEAAYRGLRLPLNVVRRGLDYHSAHYIPVALAAAITVGGYQLLLAFGILTGLSATRYIYVLCAEVILAAAYLFITYWKGMRNMLFANA